MTFLARAAVILALPAAVAAQNVAEVQVAPPSVTLKIGERSGLLATAFDRVGNVIPTVRVLWSSNNIQVAKVDNNGTVTGVGNGVAIIEARAGNRKGTAAVRVVGGVAPPPADQALAPVLAPDASVSGQPAGTGPASMLRLEPPTIYLLPSENLRASPRALKEDGSPAAPVAVRWSSLRPDIASVDQNGVIVALSVGQGTIQVQGTGGLTATAPVVVQQADLAIQEPGPVGLSPGGLDTLHVIVPSQANRPVSPLALQWTSSDPNIIRVSLTGVITAVGPGKATLSVTGLLQTRSVEVIVHRPVELLAVRPRWQDTVAVPTLTTAKFDAQALASDRTPVPEAPLRWSLADTTLASFDPATGVLTAKKAGKTQLVVRGPSPGLSVTWNVRIVAAGIKLSTTRLGLPLGRRSTLKGSYVDEQGNVIGPPPELTWTSETPQVATVGEDGAVTAVGYGRGRVGATAPGGKRATVDIFVQGEIVIPSSRSGKFQLYSAERANLAQLKRVGDDTAVVTEPAFSPDGSRIAYSAQRQIYVMDADGTNLVRFTNAPSTDGHAAFTPDGSAILFQSDRTAHSEIFLQPLSATEPVQLTQEPNVNAQPAMSPDGESIAFVSTRDGGTNIWLMGKDGSNQRPFTRNTGTFKSIEPRFLRDGSLVYLLQGRDGGRNLTQVIKADIGTGKVTPLTSADLNIANYSISPAGDLLALIVNVGGGKTFYKLYIQPLGTGGAPMPIPSGGTEQMLAPAFMP